MTATAGGAAGDSRDGAALALSRPHRPLPWHRRVRRDRWLLLFALPGIVALVVFNYVPLLGNVIAFQDYQTYTGFFNSPWVGLSNFSVIVNGDPEFMNALKNTLIIASIQVIVIFPIPIALALLLNSLVHEWFKRVVQNILYLPHFMSWVIVVAIFQQMLGNPGLVNSELTQHGLHTLSVIGNAAIFKELITSQVIWKDTGWGTILFLAALSQIDMQLYEAAEVDGASRMRQLWHVTLPGIRPVVILLFILRLGDVLNVGFEQIILQQPAVGIQASDVLDTYVYNNAILAGNWGGAAAVGLVKGVISIVLVFGANRVAHLFGERGIYSTSD